MCVVLTPYAALRNEAMIATRVNAPRAGATASGCEKLLPFLMTAWKQPISVLLELANICTLVEPSKSGIVKAIGGMSPTC